MKYRLFLLTIAGGLLIIACVSTRSGVEELVVETPEIQYEVEETVSEEMESALSVPSIDGDMVVVGSSQDVRPNS